MPRKTKKQKRSSDRIKKRLLVKDNAGGIALENYKNQSAEKPETPANYSIPILQINKDIQNKQKQAESSSIVNLQDNFVWKDLGKTFLIAITLLALEFIIFFANLV